jgi:galactokinase/mevalonate kinase-like predicted kinase
MDEFCRDRHIKARDLWDDDIFQFDPWHAKWFVVDNDPWQAVLKMGLLRDNRDLESWKQSPRISMSEILKQTDHDQIMLHMDRVLKKIRLSRVGYELSKREWTHQELLGWCSDETDRHHLGIDLLNLAKQEKNLAYQARLYYLHSAVTKNTDKSFQIIRKAVAYGIKQPEKQIATDGYQIRTDQVVWVTVPARLDFAGGWSDTPPYCMDHGGVVLNASVKLNGQYPIQAIAKRCQDPIIRINSIDLGQSVILQNMHELMNYAQPGQWESLAKAAFIAAGIFPEKDDSDLKNLLKNWGGGLELTLFSALPAGSGLGTSSILGSAVIACLARVFGQHLLAQDLFSRTSYMEQLLTTGGGWQDQIGGVAGGVKLIVTQKGFDQSPTLSWTQLFTEGPQGERFLLYYTGIRRMAKNILQKIVGRYLDRDKEAIMAIENLKTLAFDMKDDLDRRRIDAFGEKIDRAWHYNKLLDAGSTTPEIEQLFTNIKDHILGAKLLGAGGGGFLFIVAKDVESVYKIRSILETRPINDRARFFDFDIDPHGLEISVM